MPPFSCLVAKQDWGATVQPSQASLAYGGNTTMHHPATFSSVSTPARKVGSLPRRSLRLFSVIFAIALIAGACGGGGDAADDVVAGTSAEETVSTDAGAGDAETGEGADTDSAAMTEAASDEADTDTASSSEAAPIAQGDMTADELIDQVLEMMSGDFDPAEQEELWKEQERRTQELVQQCMTNEGFEYYIVDNSSSVAFEGGGTEWDPSNREWVEQYGLGVNTMNFIGEEIAAEQDDYDPNDDPNWAYQEGLSEGERKAYERALYGDQPEYDFEQNGQPTEEEMQAMEEAWENRVNKGCYDEAWQEGSDFAQMDVVFSTLDDEFEDIEDRIKADPRVADGLNNWVACMAEAGYAFGDPNEMYEAAYERGEELWESYEDPFAGMTEEDFENMDPEDFEEIERAAGPPAFDEELQAEISEWEITMALASFDCGEPALSEVSEELWAEYSRQVLEDNRDKISAAIEGGN